MVKPANPGASVVEVSIEIRSRRRRESGRATHPPARRLGSALQASASSRPPPLPAAISRGAPADASRKHRARRSTSPSPSRGPTCSSTAGTALARARSTAARSRRPPPPLSPPFAGCHPRTTALAAGSVATASSRCRRLYSGRGGTRHGVGREVRGQHHLADERVWHQQPARHGGGQGGDGPR